ncbi:MAG: hypothetical protein ACK4YF_05025 [Exilispira sp.]
MKSLLCYSVKIFIFILLISCFSINAFSIDYYIIDCYIDDYHINNIYNGSINLLSDYIELIYPVSFVFTSQTAFYGIADQLYFSFFGNNHQYNQFYLNGFKINSNFFCGTPLWDYYLSYIYFSLDPFNSEFYGLLSIPSGINFYSYFYIGGLFEINPYASQIIKYFAGHLAAIDRNPVSINDRRFLKYLLGFNFSYKVISKDNFLSFFNNIEILINFNNGQRTFLSYYKDDSFITLYKVFIEDFTKFQLLSLYHLNSNLDLFISFFYNYRTNYGSEFYFSIDQTKILNSISFIIGTSFNKFNLSSNISFQFESNSFTDNFDNYQKELIDVDGESLYIFIPNGIEYDLSLSINVKYKFYDNLIFHLFSDSIYSIFYPEKRDFTVNLLYYDNYFGKINFTSNDSQWLISNNNAKIKYIFINNFISADSDLSAGVSFLVNNNNISPLAFIYFDYNINLIFFPHSDFNIKVDFGKKTPPITSSLAKALNPDYLSGRYFDYNNTFLFNTVGNINSIEKGLKLPDYLYLSLSFSYENNNNFYFNIDSQFRSFQNLFWVRAENASSFSSYVYNNQTLYYISDPDISYVLTNFTNAINWLIENNLLSEDYFSSILDILRNPFYLGILFSFGKKNKNFKINASFWAYMVVGITAIGSGIFEDQIGIISENLADPNIFINGIGRMISDRSYVFKLNIAYKIFEDIWLSLIVRYRDGQPFSFITASISPNNYLNFYNQNISGDNPFSGIMGSREDCIWELNLDLSGKFFLYGKVFNFSLIIYNFFDLGFELVENVFNIGQRQPLELQIPGTISFQISVGF